MNDPWQDLRAELVNAGLSVTDCASGRKSFVSHVDVARRYWLHIPHKRAHEHIYRRDARLLIQRVKEATDAKDQGRLTDEMVLEMHRRWPQAKPDQKRTRSSRCEGRE